MSKYISEECKQCDLWDSLYGCINDECPIRMDYEEGMAEMAADIEVDRFKDGRFEKGNL